LAVPLLGEDPDPSVFVTGRLGRRRRFNEYRVDRAGFLASAAERAAFFQPYLVVNDFQ
jgi:hypothetical protein